MVITPWLGTLWGASDADPMQAVGEPLARLSSLGLLGVCYSVTSYSDTRRYHSNSRYGETRILKLKLVFSL